MSNFQIEEVPFNDNVNVNVNEIQKEEKTDLDNVIQLPELIQPVSSASREENGKEECEFPQELSKSLQPDLIDFDMNRETVCEKPHKLFGNLQKKNIQPSLSKKENNSNLGLYLLGGAFVATIGASFI